MTVKKSRVKWQVFNGSRGIHLKLSLYRMNLVSCIRSYNKVLYAITCVSNTCIIMYMCTCDVIWTKNPTLVYNTMSALIRLKYCRYVQCKTQNDKSIEIRQYRDYSNIRAGTMKILIKNSQTNWFCTIMHFRYFTRRIL